MNFPDSTPTALAVLDTFDETLREPRAVVAYLTIASTGHAPYARVYPDGTWGIVTGADISDKTNLQIRRAGVNAVLVGWGTHDSAILELPLPRPGHDPQSEAVLAFRDARMALVSLVQERFG